MNNLSTVQSISHWSLSPSDASRCFIWTIFSTDLLFKQRGSSSPARCVFCVWAVPTTHQEKRNWLIIDYSHLADTKLKNRKQHHIWKEYLCTGKVIRTRSGRAHRVCEGSDAHVGVHLAESVADSGEVATQLLHNVLDAAGVFEQVNALRVWVVVDRERPLDRLGKLPVQGQGQRRRVSVERIGFV